MIEGSAIVNGFLSSLRDAQIPLCDRGFLFGHGLFETILVLDGKIVLWPEHFQRMNYGAQKAMIAIPLESQLLADARRVVKHNITSTGNVAQKMQLRIMVTGGNSPLLWEKNSRALSPNIMMFCRSINGVAAETYRNGISLHTIQESRSVETIDIKSSNYLVQMRALAAALDTGFDDALFVASDNCISESTTASFIWFDESRNLCTNQNSKKCLPGTTLLALQRALKKQNITVLEKPLLANNLGSAMGAAIVSSTRGVVPVRSINAHQFDVSALLENFFKLNECLLEEQRVSSLEI